MGRTGEIDEIAALVAWLASEECSFSTGAVFDITGGPGHLLATEEPKLYVHHARRAGHRPETDTVRRRYQCPIPNLGRCWSGRPSRRSAAATSIYATWAGTCTSGRCRTATPDMKEWG